MSLADERTNGMATKIKPVPEPGTGCVGFAFGFGVTTVAIAGSNGGHLSSAAAIGLIVGVVCSWAGEPFFNWILRLLRWL